MRNERGAPPRTFEVTIDKIVYGGAGLGRHQGKVVFVPFSVPGDRLVVQAVEQKKSYIRASVVAIVEPGPGRVVPICTHFGRCGGCQWQHLEYQRQIEIKRQILEEILCHRFPEAKNLPINMRASPRSKGYRSRARIQLRGSGSAAIVGFFHLQSHTVEDVPMCPLFQPTLNAALTAVREARRRATSEAGIREMEIACSEEEEKWGTAEIDREMEEGYSALGKSQEGGTGPVLLRRKVGEFDHAASPSVFFQANDFMIAELASTIRELAQSAHTHSALDLYCGVGLLTLLLARRFRKVVAVESSAEACHLCEQNVSAAGLPNVRVVRADVTAWMKAVGSAAAPCFDLIVLDPPRTGAGPAVMGCISEWTPETIIYVSCDPQTLARDVAFLPARNYQIDAIEGLDLFPHTYHFETILRLRRR